MIFYRLTKSTYAADAWNGFGAKQYGGRWNHKGHPTVYVATSIALAALEVLVHVAKESLLDSYSLFSINIPDAEVSRLPAEYLPENWRQDPAPLATMDLGTGWLQSSESAALLLPSCIIPMENNAILNPQHPAFHQYLSSVTELPFDFDNRLIS